MLKIGGSISINEDGPIEAYFRKLLPVIRRIKEEHQLILCIGGWKFIRKYYKSIEKLGLPVSYGILDRLAIETIAKHKIKTVVMNGTNPKGIIKLLNGEKIGTLIYVS